MRRRTVAFLGLLLLIAASRPSQAQYMYIDVNANGVHDAEDVMNPNGTPVVLDVWLDRTHRRDGSVAECSIHDGDLAVWNSFAVHINVLNGTVAFSDYTNRLPAFSITCSASGAGFVSSATGMAVCQGTGAPTVSESLIRLFSVTMVPLSGNPSLEIVPKNSLDDNPTSFGTQCGGLNFDNTYTLGLDWFDVDGLPAACTSTCPPFLQPIADMTANEGATVTQTITASDPDGDAIQFHKVLGPPFMVVTTTDPMAGLGQIVLTPSYVDAGVGIPASVHATDGVLTGNTRTFHITVIHVNHAPVADAGGPYSGIAGVPMAFDGRASTDPDGDRLWYSWTFGDLGTAEGPTPAHTYAAGGTYAVGVTVSDGSLSSSASAVATITTLLEARAFTTRANRLLRLASGKPAWSIQVEPVARSFEIADVDFASVRLKSPGTGTISEIPLLSTKGPALGDVDGNGVADFTATFGKTDLEALFANVNGSTSVPVTIEGEITQGGTFRAHTDIGIAGSGGPATLTAGTALTGEFLTFATSRPGPATIRIFDVRGHLIRTLLDSAVLTSGTHRVPIDGRDAQGRLLPTGVYFYRIETQDGSDTGRVVLLK